LTEQFVEDFRAPVHPNYPSYPATMRDWSDNSDSVSDTYATHKQTFCNFLSGTFRTALFDDYGSIHILVPSAHDPHTESDFPGGYEYSFSSSFPDTPVEGSLMRLMYRCMKLIDLVPIELVTPLSVRRLIQLPPLANEATVRSTYNNVLAIQRYGEYVSKAYIMQYSNGSYAIWDESPVHYPNKHGRWPGMPVGHPTPYRTDITIFQKDHNAAEYDLQEAILFMKEGLRYAKHVWED